MGATGMTTFRGRTIGSAHSIRWIACSTLTSEHEPWLLCHICALCHAFTFENSLYICRASMPVLYTCTFVVSACVAILCAREWRGWFACGRDKRGWWGVLLRPSLPVNSQSAYV